MSQRIKNLKRINKLKNQFIRDKWGNLIHCEWNNIVKQEIEKLENEN